jgi:hypothetical protein
MELLNGTDAHKIASNPHTDGKTLAILAHNEDPSVRALVAGNPSTPPLVFEELAKDLIEVKRALATNIHVVNPYISQLIIQNDDPYIVFALAKNPSLMPEHMEELYRKFSYTDALLISNALCPLDILKMAYRRMQEQGEPAIDVDTKSTMCKDFINNPSTPLEILAKLYIDHPPYRVRILENVRFNYSMFEGATDQALIESLTRQVAPIY